MKYNIITAIGVLLVVVSMRIETNLKHNSLNPTGTELTNAGIIIGAIIVFAAGFLKWKNTKKLKNNETE